tara:strand:+ start:337393 stop:338112 length:720 start_codon:yes stop_codon:yes gene_type:complete
MSDKDEPFTNIEDATSNQGRDQHSAKLDALAEHLTESLIPRAPILSHGKRACLWLLISCLVFAILVIWDFPLRSDLKSALTGRVFVFELALAAIVGLSSIWAATRLMVPVAKEDVFKITRLAVVSGAVFIAWSAFQSFQGFLDGHLVHDMGYRPCFWWGIVVAIMPSIAVVYLARRGASTNPHWLHAMSFMAIFAFGWIALRLICAWDAPGHAFIFHFTPFVVFGALSGLISAKLFKTI